MTGRVSAGLMPYAIVDGELVVFLGHMGGPFWARKEDRAWSIVKGEYHPDDETPREAAAREWTEETGTPVPPGEWVELGSVTQRGGKVVQAFAVQVGDPLEVRLVSSSTVRMMWPPRSGTWVTFPELDRADWCGLEQARRRLVSAQVALLDRLATLG